MTYPLIFNLEKARDLGDPLSFSWALAWNVHKLFTDPFHLFDANIYYPNHNTLAYGDHLFGLAILALPVLLVINKPIIAYNILAFLSFVLSGYGTYLLSFHLTRNRLASIVAGIIFAFFPYRIYQLGHIHAISTQWIPFSFLFLFRFFEKRDNKNMWLFLLFTLLQILSSGNLAIFFIVALVVLSIFLFIEGKGYRDSRLMTKIGLIVLIAIIVLLPFYMPYINNKKNFGFFLEKYEIEVYSARIENYLSSASRLYFPYTSHLGKTESYLFPGLLTIILAVIGFLPRKGTGSKMESVKKLPIVVVDIGLVICIILIIVTILWGGINTELLGVKIKSRNLLTPWITFSLLLVIRRLINRSQQPFILNSIFNVSKEQICFLILVLLAISVSLGFGGMPSDKFYNFFYNYVPGFRFVRVPARLGMFVSLFLGLLAAYGVKRIINSGIAKRFIIIIIPLILIENASFPIKFYRIGDVPEVYRWLAKEKGDFAVIELPVDNYMLNIRYMYNSTKHWKRLVNGYSTLTPYSYFYLQEFSNNEMPVLLDYLDYIGVKYLILHRRYIADEQLGWINEFKDRVFFKAKFETNEVYELKDLKTEKDLKDPLLSLNEIPRINWKAVSDRNNFLVRSAFDGDLETRWDTGTPQRSGNFFTLNLGKKETICAISLDIGRNYRDYRDYPRKLSVKTSPDGIDWKEIAFRNDVLLDFIFSSTKNPKEIRYIMVFDPIQAKYINLVLKGSNDTYFWSIPEIRVFSEKN